MPTGEIPEGFSYTDQHEWVRREGTRVRVGITHHAQSELGDIVTVELPKVGKTVKKGQVLAELDSMKTPAEVFAPVSGVVEEVNSDLAQHPELVNEDPYGSGWIAVLTPSDPAEMGSLMTAEQYAEFLRSQAG